FGAAHPEPVPGTEAGLGPVAVVQVVDAAQRVSPYRDAQVTQGAHGRRHQPLAARLVDRGGPGFRDRRAETGPGGVARGGESGGPAADDEQVDHGVRAAWASAVFS